MSDAVQIWSDINPTQVFEMDLPNPELFFSSKIILKNDTKNSRKQNNYFSLKKMHCFLKVLRTFYKEISETIRPLEL